MPNTFATIYIYTELNSSTKAHKRRKKAFDYSLHLNYKRQKQQKENKKKYNKNFRKIIFITKNRKK
jgi:hypothetical protein